MRGAVGGQTEQTVITIYPQLPASIVSWHHHGSLSSPSLSPKQTFPIFSMLWNLMASCQAHNSLLAESLLSYASGKWKPMDRKSLNLLQPWLQTYLPTYVSVTCFIGRCSSFHKPNLPPMLRAPSVSRDLTLLAFSTLLYLLQTFLLYWIFFISCQTCSTPNSSLTFKSQSQ